MPKRYLTPKTYHSSQPVQSDEQSEKQREFPATQPCLNPELQRVDNPLFLHPIQAKLLLGNPHNRYEQQADQVAKQIVHQLHALNPEASNQVSTLKTNSTSETVPHHQSKAGSIQRQPSPRVDAGDVSVSAELEGAVHQARNGGDALPQHLQVSMGQALNTNLGRVRIHKDAQADRLNQRLQARAFTTGQDIFFRQGEYNPNSRRGQELIAHELTHVVQQKRAMLASPSERSRAHRVRDLHQASGPGLIQASLQGSAQELYERAGQTEMLTVSTTESFICSQHMKFKNCNMDNQSFCCT